MSLERDAFGALKVARVKGSPKPLYWRSTTLEFCGRVGNEYVHLCMNACSGTLGAGGDMRTFTSSRACGVEWVFWRNCVILVLGLGVRGVGRGNIRVWGGRVWRTRVRV